jgi:hypothetical protein
LALNLCCNIVSCAISQRAGLQVIHLLVGRQILRAAAPPRPTYLDLASRPTHIARKPVASRQFNDDTHTCSSRPYLREESSVSSPPSSGQLSSERVGVAPFHLPRVTGPSLRNVRGLYDTTDLHPCSRPRRLVSGPRHAFAGVRRRSLTYPQTDPTHQAEEAPRIKASINARGILGNKFYAGALAALRTYGAAGYGGNR